MKYKLKEIEVNGTTAYAIVKSWLYGLIEWPIVRRLKLETTAAEAENVRMKLEIKQNKKRK